MKNIFSINNIKQFFENIRNGQMKKYMFLRFAFVGGINTIHNYIWYFIFLHLGIPYMISFTMAFIISMIGSFFLNCYFTFKTKPTLEKFIQFPLTTLGNYVISSITLFLLVHFICLKPFIAGPLASILPIPITFLMTKLILKDNKLKFNNGKKIIVFIFMSLIFLLISICDHSVYIFTNKLFVNNQTDSMEQFMYFIPFIEKVIRNGDLMWSWSYGLGGDVLSEFSYYYSTSPFFYLVFIVRKILGITINYKRTIDLKLCISIFKQVLMMDFMYILLRYEGKRKHTSFIGAISYGVCIMYLKTTIAFDYMTDAMVWVPITILGYSIWKKTKKNWLLIIGMTLTIINNFYFAYMTLIFYCIYALIFTEGEGNTFKEKIKSYFLKGFHFALKILLSLGIASGLFIPSVIAFFNSDRFAQKFKIYLFFNSSFYKTLFENIFLYNNIIGVPLIALIVLFISIRKSNSDVKKKTIMSLTFFIMFLIPIFYSLFNGFSYETDRWCYILIFSIAYAIPDWIEEFEKNKNKNKDIVTIILIILILLAISATSKIRYGYYFDKAQYLIFIIGFLSICILIISKYIKNEIIKKMSLIILCCIIMCGQLLNSYMYRRTIYTSDYSVSENTIKRRGMDNYEEKEILSETIPNIDEFYRTIYDIDYKENVPMNYMYYGASAYNSLIEQNVHRWMKLDYNIMQRNVSPSRFDNFNDRFFLESAFGVKYKLLYDTDEIPYGYSLYKSQDKYKLYINENNAGFDLWYNNYQTYDKFNGLNYAEKDAVLLNTAVVDRNINDLPKGSMNFDTIKTVNIDLSKVIYVNCLYEDGILYVNNDAKITIPLNEEPLDGEFLFTIGITECNGNSYNISINNQKCYKGAMNEKWDYPVNEYTCKLNGDTDKVELTLTPGTYNLNKINAYYSSYNNYETWIKNVNKYNLEDLIVDGPYVSGNIHNEESGILALNIPFKKGWTAKVDGKKVELLKVNGIFTGIELQAGNHLIQLEYITPGLRIGALISLCSVIICILWFILKRKSYIK